MRHERLLPNGAMCKDMSRDLGKSLCFPQVKLDKALAAYPAPIQHRFWAVTRRVK